MNKEQLKKLEAAILDKHQQLEGGREKRLSDIAIDNMPVEILKAWKDAYDA